MARTAPTSVCDARLLEGRPVHAVAVLGARGVARLVDGALQARGNVAGQAALLLLGHGLGAGARCLLVGRLGQRYARGRDLAVAAVVRGRARQAAARCGLAQQRLAVPVVARVRLLPGGRRPGPVGLGVGLGVVVGDAPARRVQVGAAAVGRVHAALRVEGLERRAQRGDVVVVEAAAVHGWGSGRGQWVSVAGRAGGGRGRGRECAGEGGAACTRQAPGDAWGVGREVQSGLRESHCRSHGGRAQRSVLGRHRATGWPTPSLRRDPRPAVG